MIESHGNSPLKYSGTGKAGCVVTLPLRASVHVCLFPTDTASPPPSHGTAVASLGPLSRPSGRLVSSMPVSPLLPSGTSPPHPMLGCQAFGLPLLLPHCCPLICPFHFLGPKPSWQTCPPPCPAITARESVPTPVSVLP